MFSLSQSNDHCSMRRPGAAPKENLPNGPRSGSCHGISCHDHRPGSSRYAFRQRGKRYLIDKPRPLRRPGYVVVSPHQDASFDASPVCPSTSALFSPIGSPRPARNQRQTTTEVRAASLATSSQPSPRVWPLTKFTVSKKGRNQTRCGPF
jgi:hypothetical protein